MSASLIPDMFPHIEAGVIVGGVKLQAPLNAKRIRVLTRRKCGVLVEDSEDEMFESMEAVF